jgi:hypothetical protein
MSHLEATEESKKALTPYGNERSDAKASTEIMATEFNQTVDNSL